EHEVREPPERERSELRVPNAAPERDHAERREEVQVRARYKPEDLVEEQAERADLWCEREDLLLIANDVVAGVRHEDAEHAVVERRESDDEEREWPRARDGAHENARGRTTFGGSQRAV